MTRRSCDDDEVSLQYREIEPRVNTARENECETKTKVEKTSEKDRERLQKSIPQLQIRKKYRAMICAREKRANELNKLNIPHETKFQIIFLLNHRKKKKNNHKEFPKIYH